VNLLLLAKGFSRLGAGGVAIFLSSFDNFGESMTRHDLMTMVVEVDDE